MAPHPWPGSNGVGGLARIRHCYCFGSNVAYCKNNVQNRPAGPFASGTLHAAGAYQCPRDYRLAFGLEPDDDRDGFRPDVADHRRGHAHRNCSRPGLSGSWRACENPPVKRKGTRLGQ